MVTSHDCYIGLLKDGKQPNLASDFHPAKSESLGGQQVWTWDIPPSEGHPQPTTFYFAQIAESYFVMTNNRQDLQEVVSELTSAESPKTAPVTVPGWKTFSAYNYWAYRSIRRSGITHADAYASGLTNLPPTVMALAFFADMNARESYFQVYSSDKTMKTTPKGLKAAELMRFQPVGAGI